MKIDGQWVGFGLGDNDPKVADIKAFLRRKFSYAAALDDSPAYDAVLVSVVSEMQGRYGLPQTGIMNYATQLKCGYFKPAPTVPNVSIIHFSINGAGSTWDMGYPFDIGENLEPGVPVEKRKCFHQPIGYNTAPFPMDRGVDDGERELVRQLGLPRGPKGENCTVIPWCATAYSMGAIVFMRVLMRVLYGDLQQYKATYMGSNAFGNPMRQANHTLPGGIPVDGEGIVSPTAHDVPDVHWDFTADKGMPGSPGVDLYAKVGGKGKSPLSVENMRAIWDIVNTANPLSLAKQIFALLASPSLAEVEGAASAAWSAVDFFIAKGLTPHTTYQFIRPIAGDPRDCWQIALNHIQDIVSRVPVR